MCACVRVSVCVCVCERERALLTAASLLTLGPQVARLRQTVENGGLLPRLPPSRRSWRGGSTADFMSAQEDNTESDDEFFDPK